MEKSKPRSLSVAAMPFPFILNRCVFILEKLFLFLPFDFRHFTVESTGWIYREAIEKQMPLAAPAVLAKMTRQGAELS